MNKTKGAFDSPELWSPDCMQSSTPLTSLAPPSAFGQAVDTALDAILIMVLFIITVSLGCTMETAQITAHLRRPKGVAVAIMAQYSIMPLTAFILGKLFQLGTSESLAILICGCCPGGNLSSIFSLALRGDTNLSVVMTACSMVLAIGLMPLLLYLYLGALSEGDLDSKVPYKGIITSLVLMLIPCAIGIILNEKKPQYTGLITKAGMIMLLLSSAAIIVLSVANMGSCIMVVFSPSLLGTSALMPLTGFLLGYAVSAAFKLNDRCRRTVCMETGCQNVQLCSAILKVAFTPDIIGPLYFFPLLYLLFQLGEGFLLILVFRIHDRKKQANGKCSKNYLCKCGHIKCSRNEISVKTRQKEWKTIYGFCSSCSHNPPSSTFCSQLIGVQLPKTYLCTDFTAVTEPSAPSYSRKTLLQTKPRSVSPERRRLPVTSKSL